MDVVSNRVNTREKTKNAAKIHPKNMLKNIYVNKI